MIPIVRVFVSSTWLDLQPERLAVEKALQRMHQTKLHGMEYFGSRDEAPRQASLDEVDQSQVYVGIIGGRYGSGLTEEEYRRASEKKLPRFIYFKDEQTIQVESRDPEKETQEKLGAWKEELRKNHPLSTGPFTSPDDLAARITTDLSNWFLDKFRTQLYVNGISALPFDYAERIENFLHEYLGTATAPVPFGGREKDLSTLDAWLDDETAPPCLLMAAPAGRGKSALLVRWTQQLLARADISLVFVPISIRFRTNLSGVTFAALAARLAMLHGEAIANSPSTSTEVWRGLVTDYLRRPLPNGERLVIVLDGLDEAADWEAGPDLLPFAPPSHVRVVVSARYRAGDEDATDWLRRLGWERASLAQPYNLDTLTRESLGIILESMGFPLAQLGAQLDIVEELYRLTEGDPLLVKLYVEDLWTHKERVASLRPQDLGTLQPGLEGYFDRWWDDQRKLWGKESPLKEPKVLTVLNVLACSLGPLTQTDILHLTQHERLTTGGLDEAINLLNRFVVGNGKVNGYTFSHPRLRDYFQSRLSAQEQQAWQQRFLSWGKGIVQILEHGRLAPARASAYIVQYYGAHLEQAHATAETLLTLVTQSWSNAWETLEGTFAGFLNDVERAWKAIEHENDQAIAHGNVTPRIGDEIRCALVHASINSLATNIPIELLVQLVKYEKWTFQQGLVYARQIQDLARRADVLVRLATKTDIPVHLQDHVITEALTTARELTGQAHAEILVHLIPHRPEAVLAAAQELENVRDRSKVFAALILHRPDPVLTKDLEAMISSSRTEAIGTLMLQVPQQDRPPEQDQVLSVAQEIHLYWQYIAVLVALAPHQPKAVFAAAQELKDYPDRAKVLATLVPHLPKHVREEALDQILNTTRVFSSLTPGGENPILEVLALYRPDTVLATVATIEIMLFRVPVLIALAPSRPEAVLAITLDLEDIRDRAQVLAALAAHIPESVLAAVQSLDHHETQIEVLVALLPHVSKQNRGMVLAQTVTAAQSLENSWAHAQVLLTLIPHISGQERETICDQAMSTVPKLTETWQRAEVLKALAPYRPKAVVSTVWTLDNNWAQTHVLLALIPCVAQPERDTLLDHALTTCRRLNDIWSHTRLFLTLAPHQPEAILAACRKIPNSWAQAQVLAALAPHQPEAVLAATHVIHDRAGRADVLAALTPHRPDAALATAQTLDDHWALTQVLLALAPQRPDAVLAAAHALNNREAHTKPATALASPSPQRNQKALLNQALALARKLKDDTHRAKILVALAAYQPEAVLAATRKLNDPALRAEVWVALAPHRPKAVLDAAQRFDAFVPRAKVLAALAPHRPEAVLDATQTLTDHSIRAEVLAALAPHQSKAVLATAQTLDHRESQIKVLMALFPHLSKHDQQVVVVQALTAAQTLKSGGSRHQVLASQIPQSQIWLGDAPYPLWQWTLRCLAKQTRKDLMDDLSALTPIVEELGKAPALECMAQAVQDVTTWWP